MSRRSNTLTEDLWDHNIRVDQIIWLPGSCCSINEKLEEFLEDYAEKAERLLGYKPPCNTSEFEDYLTELSRKGKAGYLIKASTPCRQAADASYSWGYTTNDWFYFEVLDEREVVDTLCRWVAGVTAPA